MGSGSSASRTVRRAAQIERMRAELFPAESDHGDEQRNKNSSGSVLMTFENDWYIQYDRSRGNSRFDREKSDHED